MPQVETKPVKNPVWGDLLAEVQGEYGTQWVRVAPVYAARKGSKGQLEMILHVEPLAWRNSNSPRRLIIVKREKRNKCRKTETP